MLGFIAVVFILFGLRLGQLQLLEYGKYATLSRDNYLRLEKILPLRGRIFDRNGVLLAGNKLVEELEYRGGPVLYEDRLLSLLKLKALPQAHQGWTVVSYDVPNKLVPSIAELVAGQPNLRLVQKVRRYYPHPITGSLIGYTLLPNAEQVAEGYSPDQEVGAAGLEASLQPILQGTPGLKLVEVNAYGQVIRERILRPPIPGQDVYLTIDYRLQEAAQKALQDAIVNINYWRKVHGLPFVHVVRGAIVAIDPRTGAVLAMASAPNFNPNLFTQRPIDSAAVEALLTDHYRPLEDRAVEAYPPGSVFKVVSASMFLNDGYVTPQTTFDCSPYIIYGGMVRHNWWPYDMGPFNVEQALAQSCDTWFYQVAALHPYREVGQLAERAREFGLGGSTGLELPEAYGLVPTIPWKEATLHQPWYPGQTLSYVIGQDALLVTPAQMARVYAAIMMSGRIPSLRLVHRIGDQLVPPKITQIPGKGWRAIQAGLRLTVTWGTSHWLMGSFPVPTAGKTGTAQTDTGRYQRPQAWYAGYGPTDPNSPLPPLVVVAFFEHAGEGSYIAMPAVRQVMAAYWGIGQKAIYKEVHIQPIPDSLASAAR